MILLWLLLKLEVLILIVLIVFTLFVFFLILRLLLNLAVVCQFLLVILNKLLIIAIPLSNFLDLIWVYLHMIQNYWFDIVVIFLHNVFIK